MADFRVFAKKSIFEGIKYTLVNRPLFLGFQALSRPPFQTTSYRPLRERAARKNLTLSTLHLLSFSNTTNASNIADTLFLTVHRS